MMTQGKRFLIATMIATAWGLGGISVTAEEVTVHLTNGDVLKGELVSEGQVVSIKHSLLGKIDVPKAHVKRLARAGDSKAQEKQPAKKATVAKAPKGSSSVSKKKTTEPEPNEPASGFWSNPLVSAMTFEEWSKQFEFGMNNQRGRRIKEDYSLRYSMRRRVEKNDYRFLAQKFYGETDDDVTSDRALSSFRWRKDISPGVFYQTDTLYSSDAVKEIDLNLEQKLGLGYRFINQKDLKVNTGLGLSSRYRDDTRGTNSDYLLSIFEDVDYRLNPRFRITQEFSMALPPEDFEEYEIEFKTGVVSKVTEALHMSVRYQLVYDRSQPRDRREDQRFVSSIGFDF